MDYPIMKLPEENIRDPSLTKVIERLEKILQENQEKNAGSVSEFDKTTLDWKSEFTQIQKTQTMFVELLAILFDKMQTLEKYQTSKSSPAANKLEKTSPPKKESEFSPVKINELIIDTLGIIKDSNPKIPIKLGLDADMKIKGDKSRLIQALVTILDNSIKATERGHIKVESFVVRNHNRILIRITDTGKKFSEKLLENNFQTNENTVHTLRDENFDYQLCSSVINSHKGEFKIKNNEHVGVTFTIFLPTTA